MTGQVLGHLCTFDLSNLSYFEVKKILPLIYIAEKNATQSLSKIKKKINERAFELLETNEFKAEELLVLYEYSLVSRSKRLITEVIAKVGNALEENEEEMVSLSPYDITQFFCLFNSKSSPKMVEEKKIFNRFIEIAEKNI